MITEKQFENFAHRQGITPESAFLYELCKATWLAAEKTCLKSYNKVPALLQSDKSVPVSIPIKIEYANELSHSDIQYMVDNIRGVLSNYEEQRKYISDNIQTLWQKCNPDDSSTINYFYALNSLKTQKENFKQSFKKLSDIQRKLKRMR